MPAFIARPSYIDAVKWTGDNFQSILDLFPDISDHFGINEDGDLNYTGTVIAMDYYVIRNGLSVSWMGEEDFLHIYQPVVDKNQKFMLQ